MKRVPGVARFPVAMLMTPEKPSVVAELQRLSSRPSIRISQRRLPMKGPPSRPPAAHPPGDLARWVDLTQTGHGIK